MTLTPMRTRTIMTLLPLFLICLAGRTQAADGSVQKIETPVLKMTGMAVTAMRNPKITTPALQMTGMAVTTMRNFKITTPALQMTGIAVTAMRNSKITTPTLQMTGMAVTTMRNSKITTPTLQMTGMAVTTMRNPKITTPTLRMTGMAVTDWSPEDHRREGVAQPSSAGTAREDEVSSPGNKFTFSVPVELENMPDEADSFKVAVSVAFSGGGSRSLINETEKSIRHGRFDGTVSVSVELAPSFSGKALNYKAYLTICNAGACVSPLEEGSPAWARPEPGSSPKIRYEGPLTSQTAVDVPTLSMTGNKTDDRVTQNPPAKNADFESSSRQGSDLVDAPMGDSRPKSNSKKNSY